MLKPFVKESDNISWFIIWNYFDFDWFKMIFKIDADL